MATHEFNNQSSQAERREVLRNDSYFSRQSNTVDDAGGRFTKLTPNILTGQSQQVPQQPASSYWAQGLDEVCGPEPAFGVDVNAQEPVGTPKEIQASLEVVGVKPPLCADDLGGSMAPNDAALSSDVETDPPKPEKSRVRW